MPSPLDRAGAALLPLGGLAVLAGGRCRGDVQVVVDGQRAWVSWPAGEAEVWEPLLAPLGLGAEPDLLETALRAAAEVSLNELLLLTPGGAEAIPESAFEPLSLAGVRLAARAEARRA